MLCVCVCICLCVCVCVCVCVCACVCVRERERELALYAKLAFSMLHAKMREGLISEIHMMYAILVEG